MRRHPEIGDVEFGRKLANLRARVAENPGRPLVVMLGSSRVATGLRPEVLNSRSRRGPLLFNFAQVGAGPEMAHLCLHRLLEAGIRPDTVLVELWPPSWAVERGLPEFLGQVNLGSLTRSDERLLRRYVAGPDWLDGMWIETQWAPLWSNRLALLASVAPGWGPDPGDDRRCRNLDGWGWWSPKTAVGPEESRRLAERYRSIYERRLKNFRVHEVPDRALRGIVERCRREGIEVGVVILPEGTAFRGLYPDRTRVAVTRYLEQIETELHVPVVDAREWVADDGFMDGHHLLPGGAGVFTARLGRELGGARFAAKREIPEKLAAMARSRRR